MSAVSVLTKYCILSQGGEEFWYSPQVLSQDLQTLHPCPPPQGLSLGILSFAGDKEIREEICRGLLPGK